jgi:branched-chain amino acid transport system substrate-binding protein
MDWVFIVSQPADIWLTPVVEDMHRSSAMTVGYIGFSDAWGDLCYAGLTRLAPAYHLKVISNERYARSDTSVTAQVLRLLANKPDVIFVGGSGSAGALPELALQKRGWKGRTYNTPGVFDRDFLRVGGSAVEGVVVPTGPGVYAAQLPDDIPIKPVGLAFIRKYEAANGVGTANYLAGNAYDSSLIIVDAAKRALKQAKPGSPEFRRALRDAIFQVHELAGVNGIYNYDAGSPHGVDTRAVILMRVVQGQWQLKK